MDEAPLRDLSHWVATTYKIPVEVDIRALEDIGLDPDIPLTCRHSGTRPLRAILSSTLSPLNLTFIVQNNALLITTKESGFENSVVAHYPLPTSIVNGQDIQRIVDLIQSMIAPDTWDVVGGQGAIRPIPEANEFVVRAALDTHLAIRDMLRSGYDNDLEPPQQIGADTRTTIIRTYTLAESSTEDLPQWIHDTTNGALGSLGDPEAKVSLHAGRIVVESTSRPFHVFVAELIRSVNGISWVEQATPIGGMGGRLGL